MGPATARNIVKVCRRSQYDVGKSPVQARSYALFQYAADLPVYMNRCLTANLRDPATHVGLRLYDMFASCVKLKLSVPRDIIEADEANYEF